MNKYINCKIILDKLDVVYKELMKGHYVEEADGITIAYNLIKNMQDVNLKEEVYAEWILYNGHDIRDNLYKCSVCGRTINVICGDNIKNYPYCRCGAKMKI